MTNRRFVLLAFGIDTKCVELMSKLQVTDFRRRINTFLRPVDLSYPVVRKDQPE